MAEVLMVLLTVLLVVTLVGHGIWVGLARLFRSLAGSEERAQRTDQIRCGRCRLWTSRFRTQCDWCGRELHGAVAEELADLVAFERQLKRFQSEGLLEPTALKELQAKVQARHKALEQPSPAPAESLPRPPRPAIEPTEAKEPIVVAAAVAEVVSEPAKAPPLPRPQAPPREPAVAPVATIAKPPSPPQPAKSLSQDLARRRGQALFAPKTPQNEPVPGGLGIGSKTAKPAPPKPPRKPLLETLAAFLEERNIHWAELVCVLLPGLVIVGASIALVISFWETLEQTPYLKFSIFVAYSSTFFGVGLLCHRRWKLESIGRVLLWIAALLVPLNFLAMASLSREYWSLMTLATEVVSLGIFAWLMWLAGRTILPAGRWHQTAAVVGNSAAVLLVARLTGWGAEGWSLAAVGLIPVGIFAAAILSYLARPVGREDRDKSAAEALFTLLGTATFSLAVALGLLVERGARTAGFASTLDHTSLLLALSAVPLLAAGLAVVQRTTRDKNLAAYRTAGTAVALTATLFMVAAVGIAWPDPVAVLFAGGVAAAALAWTAFRYDLPPLHAGAIAAATVVYLTAYHLIVQNLSWVPGEYAGRDMLRLAAGLASGTALTGLVVLLGLISGLLEWTGRRRHAIPYVAGAGILALVSVLNVTGHVFYGTSGALSVAVTLYGLYGVGTLAASARLRRPVLTYVGFGLLAAATLWGLRWQVGGIAPIWATVLASEAVLLGIVAAVLHRIANPPAISWNAEPAEARRGELLETYRLPAAHVAELLAPLAVVVGVWTAWSHRAMIDASPELPLAALLATGLWVLLAWGYRSPVRTYVASLVALAGLIHTFVFNYTDWVEQPWLIALLSHASISVVAGLALHAWLRTGAAENVGEDVRRVFTRPLGEIALASSAMAIPAILLGSWGETLWMAGCLGWLAAIWLAIAWTNRWPAMFAAAQAALTVATVTGTTAWIQRNPWNVNAPVDLTDPRVLQAYGIGLAVLTLVWLAARMLLRKNHTGQELFDCGGPSVDRVVGHSVAVLQFLLIAILLFPGCIAEFGGSVGGAPVEGFGATAWLLLGLLAVGLVAALWYRWREAEIVSSLLAAATVPALVAGAFGGQVAMASAMRWASASTFLIAAAAIAARRQIFEFAQAIRARVEATPLGPSIARATLLVTTAMPVLALTLIAAGLQLAGIKPSGPLPETFFDRAGTEISYLIPLVLVIGSLIVFAIRESSAGYVFSAGLVVQLAVVLGYLLGLRTFGTTQLATVVQLATITAAAWAILWLVARRWVEMKKGTGAASNHGLPEREDKAMRSQSPFPSPDVWREGPRAESARVLMRVQLAMGVLGNAVLLVPAIMNLVFSPYRWQGWAAVAGSWIGWTALIVSVASLVLHQVKAGRRVSPNLAGAIGMAALALLACTVRALMPDAPEWGYRTLMLGWATYSLVTVLATWWVASLRTLPGAQGPPQALLRAASTWVSTAGLLGVALGVKAAFFHQQDVELLWAAAAIAVASLAGATMAFWRRAEGWAFAAAPGVNLAASLVVWYVQAAGGHRLSPEAWLILLGQANVIASMAVALVWLAARKRLYELRELSIRTSPHLGIQTSLGVIGNAALLAPPVAALFANPGSPQEWLPLVAAGAGWVALVLTGVVAAWYLWQVRPQQELDVLAGLGLGGGVLYAGLVAGASEPLAGWTAYHVLTASWAVVGLVVLGAGIAAGYLRLSGRGVLESDETEATDRPLAPAGLVQGWVTAIATAVLTFGLVHCVDDPARPWWSLGAIGSVSLAAGVLGVWLRQPLYVLASAVMFNVAGTVWWWISPEASLGGLAAINILAFAAGAILWSLVEQVLGDRVPAVRGAERSTPVSHLAALAGLVLLAVYAWALVVSDSLGIAHAVPDLIAWCGLGGTALAALVLLWDVRARFPLASFYATALAGLAMGLSAQELMPVAFAWTASIAIAAFVLLSAIVGRWLPRGKRIAERLGIRSEGRWPVSWFPAAQMILALAAAGLSLWISLDTRFVAVGNPILAGLVGRPAGPLAIAMLLPAVLMMIHWTNGRSRSACQTAVFLLGLMLAAESGWAWLDPAIPAPWLHRTVVAMVAAVVMTLVAGLGVPRLAPATDWTTAARRIAPWFGGLAFVSLAAVLVQEASLHVSRAGVPMAMPAVLLVATALAGLIAAALVFAVVGRLDPLGLSDRGRTAYVYAAEALGALIGLHFWLTVPEWFQLGIVRQYWMLFVLGIAFAGAALSELFQRRGLPVLSEPLMRTAALLPIAPAIGFWFFLEAEPEIGFVGATPALWLLASAFYALLAVMRRSAAYGTLAGVVLSVGLCVLWFQLDFQFFAHPQLWLIPFALVVLLAEYLNHDRLSERQSTALRYIALSVIYISSSSEYLRSIGESLALPMVLILLSMAGVLIGVVLRIRSFLYMGSSFLMLVVVTMIKYAAVDQRQTWILWVFCIVLCTAVMATFAVFEKRREEILTAVKRFRTWQQ